MSLHDGIEKIYSDDPNLRYKTTTKRPIDSKSDIDGILAKHGITKFAWDWDIPNNNVQLSFQLSERFKDQQLEPMVQLKPPIIWMKHKRGKADQIDWRLSMRIFLYYIENQLQMAYAFQSKRTLAFLPHIVVRKGAVLADVILDDLRRYKALPEKEQVSSIIDVEAENP